MSVPEPAEPLWQRLAHAGADDAGQQVSGQVEEVDVVKGNMTCRYVKWIVYWCMPGDWIISVRQNVILPHNNINVFYFMVYFV